MRGLTKAERELLLDSCEPADADDPNSPDGDVAICDRLVRRGLLIWVDSPFGEDDGQYASITATGRLALELDGYARTEWVAA